MHKNNPLPLLVGLRAGKQEHGVVVTRTPKMEAITARLAVVESVIAKEKAELNAAEGDKASDLRLSLAELRVEKAALLELSLIAARAAAAAPPVPVRGKNTPSRRRR